MNIVEKTFWLVCDTSWRTGCLILVLLALRRFERGRIPARILFVAWVAIAVRLLVPLGFSSAWSPFNLAHLAAGAPAAPGRTVPFVVDPVSTRMEGLAASLGMSANVPSHSVWNLPLGELAAAVWLLGLATLLAVRAAAVWRFHCRLKASVTAASPRLAALANDLSRRLGIPAVAITVSNAVATPALVGLLRPRLLIPPGFEDKMSDDELRFVLAHEFAHRRYHDLAAQAAIWAVRTLHWFNPLVWCAAMSARTDCEIACDEFVIRNLASAEPGIYGETLLKAVALPSRLTRVPGALGIADSKRRLKDRLRRIVAFRRTNRALALAGAGLLLALVMLSLTRETRADPSPESAPLSPVTIVPWGWSKNGLRASNYEVGVDPTQMHDGGSSAYVKSIKPVSQQSPEPFGGMMQTCSAKKYVGKRLRFSAWMRTKDTDDGGAHLWFRVDTAEKSGVQFDNMSHRPVNGTTGWTRYSEVLDVPAGATLLAYGFFVEGNGEAWVSAPALDEVGADVPVTGRAANVPIPQLREVPENMAFDYGKTHLWMIQFPRSYGETDAALRAKAQEVTDRLSAGEKFEALSKIYGKDAGRTEGGDWGWQSPSDIKPEFRDQIFKAATGTIVGPIIKDGPDGCFLFYIVARR